MNLALQKNQQKNQTDGLLTNYVLNRKEETPFPMKAGSFITAAIIGKTAQKTSLQAVDFPDYTFDAVGVKGEVGDQVSFEVLQSDKERLVLKQVFNQMETTKAARTNTKHQALSDMKELLTQSHFIKEENVLKPEDRVDEQIKTANAVAKIRRQLAYPAANASLSAVNELVASGLSLQKISLPLLNSVMKEIEAKPVKEISSEALSPERGDVFGRTKNEGKSDIGRALNSCGLPITAHNVKALQKTLSQASEIENLEEDVIVDIIQKEKPLTLESVYISRFSSKASKARRSMERERLSPDTWQALLPEIEKVFKRENIESTEKNRESARFLVENQCPVTSENIRKQRVLQHVGERLSRDELLAAAARNIKRDRSVTDIPLYAQEPVAEVEHEEELYENYCQLIEILPQVTERDISGLIRRGHPITLNTLRNEKTVASLPVADVIPVPEARTTKRQLAEIALKLTYEAAYRLARKNIRIDTVPLSQALERLKSLEQEGYEKNLRSMGVAADDKTMAEKRTLMTDLYEKLSFFRPHYLLSPHGQDVSGQILSQKISFTINSVHTYLQEAYDRQQTPNPRYGDSFHKVEDQFASFLERRGIDADAENVRAASILSRNELDVTEENITRIKSINYKLHRLADSLHPNIAANMIKEGYNPVEMRIDEILDYIKGFEQVYGNSLSDKLSERILKLDESGSIEQDVREPMIALYRMLNMIAKNGGAALGLVLHDKTNPTLGDLMEASKSYTRTKKGERLDYSIHDNFGRLTQLVRPETNIRQLLENGKRPEAVNTRAEYQSQLLTSLGELATPDRLQELLRQPDFYDRTLEDIVKALTEQGEQSLNEQTEQSEKETVDFYVRQLQELSTFSPTVLQILDSYGIAPTLGNIFAMQNLEKYVSSFDKLMDKMEDSEEKDALLAEIPDSEREDWIDEVTGVYDSLAEKIEALKETLTSRAQFRELTALQNALHLQKSLYDNGSSIQLPFKLHDRVASLRLYIINKEVKNEMNIFMSLETRSLGEVQARIVTDGQNASLRFSAETSEGLAALREGRLHLDEYLEDIPLKMDEISFSAREEESEITFERQHTEKNGRRLSFQNSSSNHIKKLVSAIAKMIEEQDKI